MYQAIFIITIFFTVIGIVLYIARKRLTEESEKFENSIGSIFTIYDTSDNDSKTFDTVGMYCKKCNKQQEFIVLSDRETNSRESFTYVCQECGNEMVKEYEK